MGVLILLCGPAANAQDSDPEEVLQRWEEEIRDAFYELNNFEVPTNKPVVALRDEKNLDLYRIYRYLSEHKKNWFDRRVGPYGGPDPLHRRDDWLNALASQADPRIAPEFVVRYRERYRRKEQFERDLGYLEEENSTSGTWTEAEVMPENLDAALFQLCTRSRLALDEAVRVISEGLLYWPADMLAGRAAVLCRAGKCLEPGSEDTSALMMVFVNRVRQELPRMRKSEKWDQRAIEWVEHNAQFAHAQLEYHRQHDARAGLDDQIDEPHQESGLEPDLPEQAEEERAPSMPPQAGEFGGDPHQQSRSFPVVGVIAAVGCAALALFIFRVLLRAGKK